MILSEIILLLGGICLFLFGMSVMGDGLKKASGSRLAPILYQMSNTRLKGVLLGTGVTALIQSSGATSVMVVGFVNSKMMKMDAAIHVILGSIIGTSITGWVICLSYIEGKGSIARLLSTATITGVSAIIGTMLRMLSKKQIMRNIGDILLGFAVLMFGMMTMSDAVQGMRENETFIRLFTTMSHPILGILIGAAFTAILQSASAAVGILQALSVTGAIGFRETLPLLMGIAIGAAFPVMLASLGATTLGKRTAFIYPVAVSMGVAVVAVLFYPINSIYHFSFMDMPMNPFSIAALNTILRVAMVVLLLPSEGLIEKVVCLLFPDTGEEEFDPKFYLEERFLKHPAAAIEQSRNAINHMALLSKKALDQAIILFSDYSSSAFEKVVTMEDMGDRYEDALGTYLVQLTAQSITHAQNRDASLYLHTLSDFERISDHALNLAENAKELHDKDLLFSDRAKEELTLISKAVTQVLFLAVDAFIENDLERAKQVEPLEEWIDDLSDMMKLNHVNRLQREECSIIQGFIFNDILTNLERISDHCSNIAVAMIELSEEIFATHEYLHDVKTRRGAEFDRYYEEYKKEFALPPESSR